MNKQTDQRLKRLEVATGTNEPEPITIQIVWVSPDGTKTDGPIFTGLPRKESDNDEQRDT